MKTRRVLSRSAYNEYIQRKEALRNVNVKEEVIQEEAEDARRINSTQFACKMQYNELSWRKIDRKQRDYLVYYITLLFRW